MSEVKSEERRRMSMPHATSGSSKERVEELQEEGRQGELGGGEQDHEQQQSKGELAALMRKGNAVAAIDGVSYFGILEKDPLHARASPDWLHRVLDCIEREYNLDIEMRHIFDALMDPSLHDFPSERKRNNTRRSLLRNMQQAHFRVHQRYLKPFRTNCQNPDCSYAGRPIEIPVEGGVDVAITTFVLADLPKHIDTILLWVKEPDYMPLLKVLAKSKALHIYVICDDFAHVDLALKHGFKEKCKGNRDCIESHFISLKNLYRYYPTARPENIVVPDDMQRLETTMALNKRFRKDIAQEYERTGSVEKACSLTFLSEDDIQELVEEYGEDLVTAARKHPECPCTYLEVVQFIEDVLLP